MATAAPRCAFLACCHHRWTRAATTSGSNLTAATQSTSPWASPPGSAAARPPKALSMPWNQRQSTIRAAAQAGPACTASRTSPSVKASQPMSRVWARPDAAHQSISIA
jgi:hypothetical protein